MNHTHYAERPIHNSSAPLIASTGTDKGHNCEKARMMSTDIKLTLSQSIITNKPRSTGSTLRDFPTFGGIDRAARGDILDVVLSDYNGLPRFALTRLIGEATPLFRSCGIRSACVISRLPFYLYFPTLSHFSENGADGRSRCLGGSERK